MRGSITIALARLVSGASAATVTVPGARRITMSISQSTASPAARAMVGRGSVAPPRPPLPWLGSAAIGGPASGRAAPAKIGMSGRPASSQIRRALSVASASETLPSTVVRPSSSSSGEASASRMAMASSTPGSVSMMMARRSAGSSRTSFDRRAATTPPLPWR